VLLPLIVKMSKEFKTEKELESYLEAHPDADKSLHSVTEPDKGGKSKKDEGGKPQGDKAEKKQSLYERVTKSTLKGNWDKSDPIWDELADASPEAIDFIADSDVRSETMAGSAGHLREERDAGVAQAAKEATKGGVNLDAAGDALAKVKKGEKPTDEEAEAIGEGAASVTQSAVNMGVAKKGRGSYAKALLYRLYESFFEFIVDELSKLDGLQNLSELTTKNPWFRKKFNLMSPEEIRTQHQKWDDTAEKHGLESTDIDKIQEAQSYLRREIKGKPPTEAWSLILERLQEVHGDDKETMDRFKEIDATDYHEINNILQGKEPNKKHKPSHELRDELKKEQEQEQEQQEKEKEQQEKEQQAEAKAEAKKRQEEATKQRDKLQRRYKLTREDIEWISDIAKESEGEGESKGRGKGKTKAKPKSDAQKMQEFLAKAGPDTRDRMKGLSPAEFMKILGAIMDEEAATAAAKTAAAKPSISFTAEIYDMVADLFEKGVSDEQMSKMLAGKKPAKKEAAIRAATIRLAYENPHLRKHLLPLLTR